MTEYGVNGPVMILQPQRACLLKHAGHEEGNETESQTKAQLFIEEHGVRGGNVRKAVTSQNMLLHSDARKCCSIWGSDIF